MADNTVDLMRFVSENKPTGDFKPYAYYGEEEDSLTLYFRNEPDYARRINSRVTVYRSLDSDRLVGCQIKSVRNVLEDIGWFDVTIHDEVGKLKLVLVAYLGTLSDDDAREAFHEVGKAVSNWPSEVPKELV